MSFLAGHIPGFHLPGTLIPIGAVVAQQQQMAQEQEQLEAGFLLLCTSQSGPASQRRVQQATPVREK